MKNLLFISLLLSLLTTLVQPSFSIPIISSIFLYWFVWIAGAFLAERYHENKQLFKKYGLTIFILCFICLIICKHSVYLNNLQMFFATLGWLAFFDWFLNVSRINLSNYLFRSLTTLGICSYSFYLIHQPHLANLMQYFNITAFGKNHLLELFNLISKVIIAFIILFSISYTFYSFMEIKSISMGAKILAKRKVLDKKII
jgi:peptidoglycan/LPS O-acetylase OafA/YrhL